MPILGSQQALKAAYLSSFFVLNADGLRTHGQVLGKQATPPMQRWGSFYPELLFNVVYHGVTCTVTVAVTVVVTGNRIRFRFRFYYRQRYRCRYL